MHLNSKLIAWVVITLFVGAGAYAMFTATAAPALDANGNPAAGGTVGSDLLSLLGKLQKVDFTTTVFSDPTFKSLTDLSVTLPSPSLGRPNPFEKIGVDIGSVVTPVAPSLSAVTASSSASAQLSATTTPKSSGSSH